MLYSKHKYGKLDIVLRCLQNENENRFLKFKKHYLTAVSMLQYVSGVYLHSIQGIVDFCSRMMFLEFQCKLDSQHQEYQE